MSDRKRVGSNSGGRKRQNREEAHLNTDTDFSSGRKVCEAVVPPYEPRLREETKSTKNKRLSETNNPAWC